LGSFARINFSALAVRSNLKFPSGKFPFRSFRLSRIGIPDLDGPGHFRPLPDDEINFTAIALIIYLLVAGPQMVQDDVLRKPAGIFREAEGNPVGFGGARL
jgi:hypothetical protein